METRPFFRKAIIRVFAIIVSLMILSGCDNFTTRQPDEPSSDINWHTFPITADLAFENLELAWEYEQNLNYYTGLFTSDFVFYFDAGDYANYHTPYSWGRLDETEVLYSFYESIPVGKTVVLTFETIDDEDDVYSATEVTLYRDYLLTYINAYGVIEKKYQGRCVVHLVDENGFWKIDAWYDHRTDNGTTWGRLKYALD